MQNNKTFFITGIPAAGKTTLARVLKHELEARNRPTVLLDGDEIRLTFASGLGYTKEDRDVNVVRAGMVAKTINDNGFDCIIALVAPYRSTRGIVRETVDNFIEIFVDCSVDVCAGRDPKGLYAKAKAGDLDGLTGFNDVYEAPLNPEIYFNANVDTLDAVITRILSAA